MLLIVMMFIMAMMWRSNNSEIW